MASLGAHADPGGVISRIGSAAPTLESPGFPGSLLTQCESDRMWPECNRFFGTRVLWSVGGVGTPAGANVMRNLTTGAALALFFCGSAVAAELSVSTPPYAPRPAAVLPLYDWTGCFIGPNLGGGW